MSLFSYLSGKSNVDYNNMDSLIQKCICFKAVIIIHYRGLQYIHTVFTFISSTLFSHVGKIVQCLR